MRGDESQHSTAVQARINGKIDSDKHDERGGAQCTERRRCNVDDACPRHFALLCALPHVENCLSTRMRSQPTRERGKRSRQMNAQVFDLFAQAIADERYEKRDRRNDEDDDEQHRDAFRHACMVDERTRERTQCRRDNHAAEEKQQHVRKPPKQQRKHDENARDKQRRDQLVARSRPCPQDVPFVTSRQLHRPVALG